jgi:GT2 family glycosyltransferase
MALITCIAYDTERNLGRAYNEIMEGLAPGDWCCFLDHDAMWTTPRWRAQLEAAILEHPRAGLFAAVTNRIGRKFQVVPGAPAGHRLLEHLAFGEALRAKHGSKGKDVTNDSPISGVVMCLSRETWARVGGFKDGFFGVDNRAHQDVARAGRRVVLLPGLYVYHWYRGDGEGHEPGAPRARLS